MLKVNNAFGFHLTRNYALTDGHVAFQAKRVPHSQNRFPWLDDVVSQRKTFLELGNSEQREIDISICSNQFSADPR